MIACVGDIMVDIFLLSDLQRAEQGDGILLRGGGSAANTAAWLARTGAETVFIGRTGEDAAGAMLTQELAACGVIPCIRTVPEAETGAVLVRVDDDGTERVMRSSRGANTALSPDDLATADVPALTCIHLTGYALLGPAGLDLLEAAARIAKARQALLSFDPSSPSVIERIGAATLLQAMNRCGVAILLPNAAEAAAMTGKTVPAAAQALREYVPTVLIKAGANGAVFATASSSGAVPIRPARPIDPTGAGDAFDAGAIAALVAGKSVADACREGVMLASEVLVHYGGRPV